MINICKYNQDKKTTWNSFLENSKNGVFMFHRDFMEYHGDRFTDFSLLFYEDDTLLALLPASIHDDEIRSHGGLTFGGMITDTSMKQHKMDDCFAALLCYLKQQKISKLLYKTIPMIYHTLPAQEDLYPLWVHNAQIVRRGVSTTINLQNPESMQKRRKRQITKAEKSNVIVEESTDFESFIALENSVLRQYHNTTAVHTAEELKLLASRFPENIKLYIATKDKELIAGTLLFISAHVVHTQYLASSDLGRTIGALDLLIATLIQDYIGSKKYFDFGISTEQNDRVFNSGLCAQKEGFGGRSIMYDIYALTL